MEVQIISTVAVSSVFALLEFVCQVEHESMMAVSLIHVLEYIKVPLLTTLG